uniref:Uncharacterized protein n=1 Tax=Pongo abelii TaxID=9601 RepID=A0A8I5T0U9_PONAB
MKWWRGCGPRARGLALPIFSQDAHREGCQCGHCLHFFFVSPWHSRHPGVWTGGQALHAAPVFTWGKMPGQKGLEKASPSTLCPRPDIEESYSRPTAGHLAGTGSPRIWPRWGRVAPRSFSLSSASVPSPHLLCTRITASRERMALRLGHSRPVPSHLPALWVVLREPGLPA